MTREQSFNLIRGQVAGVLLAKARQDDGAPRRLTQRAIAEKLGTDWGTVHRSLVSLNQEGIIRIQGRRIILKKGKLQEIAKMTGISADRGGPHGAIN